MYKCREASNEEVQFIEEELTKYNLRKKPLLQEKEFISFKHVVEDDGKIIGGVFGYSSYYKIGYIDTLWVDENYRHKGIGTVLLKAIEADLYDFGCEVIRLETFDFQGPAFYKKNGYEEFGSLYYPNANLYEIFLKK
ncbi:GNAT family N-acetyltransferase [Metasolibacillus sp. FSL K6-0083]|uniref:GNAT family N-acetyltransferase n=1 Tax=Metasolibacillus sp. FSL K6-0083 TaxID=2921416 RepID=UPI00315A5CE0